MTEQPEVEPTEGVSTDASGDVTTPTPEAAKPGDLGVRKTGDPATDATALDAYPFAALRQYAADIGVTPARSKAETIQHILAWMYPPIRKGIVGVVEGSVPGEVQMSVRVGRITGQG